VFVGDSGSELFAGFDGKYAQYFCPSLFGSGYTCGPIRLA
jgi:hypothetical protein